MEGKNQWWSDETRGKARLFDGNPAEVYKKDADAARRFWGKLLASRGKDAVVQTYTAMLENISPKRDDARTDYSFNVGNLPKGQEPQNEVLSAVRMLALTQDAVVGTYEIYRRAGEEYDINSPRVNAVIIRPNKQFKQTTIIGERITDVRRY